MLGGEEYLVLDHCKQPARVHGSARGKDTRYERKIVMIAPCPLFSIDSQKGELGLRCRNRKIIIEEHKFQKYGASDRPCATQSREIDRLKFMIHVPSQKYHTNRSTNIFETSFEAS